MCRRMCRARAGFAAFFVFELLICRICFSEKLFLPGASLTLPVSRLAGAASTPNGFQQLIQQIVQQQLQTQLQQQQQKKKVATSGGAEMIGVKSSYPQQPKAHVDFTSVQDMARSDRPSSTRKVRRGWSFLLNVKFNLLFFFFLLLVTETLFYY